MMSPSGCAHFLLKVFVPFDLFAGPLLRTDQALSPHRRDHVTNRADACDHRIEIFFSVPLATLLEIMKVKFGAAARGV
jgi:hypothetical protein